MHEGGLSFNSWFIWFMYVFFGVVLIGAVALVVNALRRPRPDFGRLGRTPWVVVQGILLVVSVGAMLAGAIGISLDVQPAWYGVMGLYLLLAAGQQIAYLLRVVFPTPARREARAEGAPDGGEPHAGHIEDKTGSA